MSALARRRIELHDLSGGLVDAQDRLELLTEQYAEQADRAAMREDAWKRAYHRRQVELAAEDAGKGKSDRRTVGERESIAMKATEAEHGAWLIAEAALSAGREALRTGRARQDAIRTLIASERALLT